MNTLHNQFLIEVPISEEGKTADGLLIDTTYEVYRNSVQYGVVVKTPEKLVDEWFGYELPQIGDKVYFHHFVHRHYETSGNLRFCDFEGLYCYVRDGKITMLGDWVLVEPVIEKAENNLMAGGYIAAAYEKESEKYGTLAYTNPKTKELGVDVDDLIAFQKDADYDIVIEGKKYFRMKNENLFVKLHHSL